MKKLKKRSIIILFLSIASVALGIATFLNFGVVYGNWYSAPYTYVTEITVMSIDSEEALSINGNAYTEWWLNGDRHFRVSQTAASALEVGKTYKMKVLHGIAADDVTAIKNK